MISKRDLQLGKLAMKAGMVTKDQITRCLALKKKLAKTKGKNVSLGALLIKKAYLTEAQLEELVQKHNERYGDEDEESAPRERRSRRAKKARAAAEGKEGEVDGGSETATAVEPAAPAAEADAPAPGDEPKRDGESKRDKKARARKKSERNGATSGRQAEAEPKAEKAEKTEKAEKAEKPEKRASDSEVDPAVFLSAPEDAVDEEDRRLVACAECGKQYRIRRKQAGKRFGCRRCRSKVKVPKDLFERPLDAPKPEPGAPKGEATVAVEEFSLGSSDQTAEPGSGSGDDGNGKTSVRTAAAKAALMVQKVQAAPTIAELAKAATKAQRKGLAPRTKFGAFEAITLLVCVVLLVGIVGGVVWYKNKREQDRLDELQKLADDEYNAWKAQVDLRVGKVDAAAERRVPIELSGLAAELKQCEPDLAKLGRGNNPARGRAYLDQQDIPGKVGKLEVARAEGLERQGTRGAREAITAWAAAARAAPANVDLQVQVARRFMASGQCAEAAARLEPLAASSQAAAALRALAFERGDAGAKAVTAWAAVQGPAVQVVIARAYIVDHAEDRAIDLLGKAAGLEGQTLAAAKVMEALARERKGDAAAARALLDASVAAAPDSPLPGIALGEHLLRQGKPQEALDALKRGNQVAGTARGFVAQGDAHAALLELDRARALYLDATTQPLSPPGASLLPGGVDPFDAPFQPNGQALAFARIGALDAAAGKATSAREDYDRAQKLDPFSVEAEVGLALCELEVDDQPLCDARLQQALTLVRRVGGAEADTVRSPAAGAVLVARGAFFVARGRYQEASDILAQAVAADPSVNAPAAALRGKLFELMSQSKRARDAFGEAATFEVQPTTLAGLCYAQAEALAAGATDAAAWEKVLLGVEAALANNPWHARAFLLRGRALAGLKRTAQALPAFERAIERNLYLRDAYVARGFFLVRDLPAAEQTRERWNQARDDFRHALVIEGDPGKAETHFGLALTYRLMNDKENALQSVNKCIELDPEYALAYQLRSGLKAERNDKPGADADKKKYEELTAGGR